MVAREARRVQWKARTKKKVKEIIFLSDFNSNRSGPRKTGDRSEINLN